MNLYVYKCPACPVLVPRVALSVDAVPVCMGHGTPTPMARVEDTTSLVMPISPGPELGPMKIETLRAAGILLPETQHALEWLYRHRDKNGMAGAFRRVGGRRCIDLVAFAKLVRERK